MALFPRHKLKEPAAAHKTRVKTAGAILKDASRQAGQAAGSVKVLRGLIVQIDDVKAELDRRAACLAYTDPDGSERYRAADLSQRCLKLKRDLVNRITAARAIHIARPGGDLVRRRGELGAQVRALKDRREAMAHDPSVSVAELGAIDEQIDALGASLELVTRELRAVNEGHTAAINRITRAR